jgi:hypothetical protein
MLQRSMAPVKQAWTPGRPAVPRMTALSGVVRLMFRGGHKGKIEFCDGQQLEGARKTGQRQKGYMSRDEVC